MLLAEAQGGGQVIAGRRVPPALAFHRAEPGQHLDTGRGGLAELALVTPPRAGQPGPGRGAVAGRVLGGGQVGLGGQHPGRIRVVEVGQLADQVVVDEGGPPVLPDAVQDGGVGGGGGDRALVTRAVQLLLGGVREGGPEAGGLRVAERDQDPGEQGRGDRELGGGTAGVGVRGAQDLGENGPGAGEIAG